MRRILRVLPGFYRFRRWLQQVQLLLLWGLLLLSLIACPHTPPPALPPPSPGAPPAPSLSGVPTAHRQAFLRADELRSRGQLVQAQQAFAVFVHQYPSSPLADDALISLGQIAASREDFHSASQAFQRLIDDFPDSEHRQPAYLELGVVLYHLRDYPRAEAMLHHFLTFATLPERQALAHYYLGVIAREQQRSVQAVGELAQSVILGAEASLTRQAHRDITRIIQEHLTPTDLEQLVQRYPTTYPGDLVLLQLAQRYREDESVFDEMAALQHFVTAFPEHPEVPVAQARLRDLQESATTDHTKIGLILPLSGAGGPYGQSALQGIELALAEWQAQYPDMPLSLVRRDSQGASKTASEAFRSLVTEERVIGVIGPLLSRVAQNLAPIAEHLQTPIISPYAPGGDFPALSAYAFRSSLTDAFQARFLAEYAVHTLNLHRFAILYPDEPYGVSLKDHFMTHLGRLRGEVVVAASYAPQTTDFSAAIKRLGGMKDETLRNSHPRASRPPVRPTPPYDAIFLPGYYDRVRLIAPALTFFNITGVQLLGSDGWNVPEITANGESLLEGAVFVDGFFVDSPLPRVQDFVSRYQARYHELPDVFAAQAYDTFLMLAQVLRDGAATRSQLRDGLLRVRDFEGVSGTTTMNAQGDAEKTPFVLTLQNGQIVQHY